MKKLLFFAVSAILAGASYCTLKSNNSKNKRWCWNSLLPSLICSQVTVRTAAIAHIALTVRTVHTVHTVLIARIILAIKNL